MMLQFADFERILAEMMPQVGRHDWALRLSRWSQTKGRHTRRHVESLMKRAMNRRKPYFIFEASGLKLFGDRRDRYARTIAATEGYEDAPAESIFQSLEACPGAYLDIGTNMGVVAAMVAKRTGRPVIAVEPNPETARRAACTFALNGLRNVTLFSAAVGDQDGEMTFYMTPGASDAASLSGENVGAGAQAIKVPVVTIDTLVERCGLDRVGFIKIDVEGFEPQAIAGARSTIQRDHPEMFWEYHFGIAPKLGWTPEGLRDQIELLAPYQYRVLRENDPVRPFPPRREDGESFNIWCRRPESRDG